MKIACRTCSTKYSLIDEKVAGKVFKLRCKKCRATMFVRGVQKEKVSAPPIPDKTTVYMANTPKWDVMIDRRQVGPLSATDWIQLGKIREFSSLEENAAPTRAQPRGRLSESYLFGNLPVPKTADLPMKPAPAFSLTAQRGENSVLFSVENLASTALAAPKPNTAAHDMNHASLGNSDGSGLVDIRSIASMYMADQGPTAFGGGPSISTPSLFDGLSTALLPTMAPARTNLLYVLSGAAATLAIISLMLLIIVFKSSDSAEAAKLVPSPDRAEQSIPSSGEPLLPSVVPSSRGRGPDSADKARKSSRKSATSEDETSKLPETLSRRDVVVGIGAVQERVASCTLSAL